MKNSASTMTDFCAAIIGARHARHDAEKEGRWRQRIIRWNDDVGRLIITTRLRDHAFHFDHAVIGIDHGMTAGRLGRNVDEFVKNPITESVVHCFAQTLILVGRHADNMVDERALGFRAHDSVDC
jgi:hypothetical protein